MDVDALLRFLVRFASPGGVDVAAVSAAVEAMAQPAQSEWVAALREAMTSGAITADAWAQASEGKQVGDVAPAIAATWDGLAEAGLAESAEGSPDEWSRDALRIWAYTEEWDLLGQDEDLILMDETLVPWLLGIGAEPECPKGAYVLDIVAHWARDEAWQAAGEPHFGECVARIAGHAPAAVRCDAPELADYLMRLGSYAQRGPVDRAGAVQRGRDLTRCHGPATVDVTEDAGEWVVCLPSQPSKTIRISAHDGRIR